MNYTLLIIALFIPIFIGFVIIYYVLTRRIKELGIKTKNKEVQEKKYYQVCYGYYFDWLKKYWYVSAVILFVIFLIFQYKSLSSLIWGFFFVLIGIFTLITNYKQLDILTSTVTYRFWREAGYEHRAKILFYVISIISLIFGLFLIFYSLLFQ